MHPQQTLTTDSIVQRNEKRFFASKIGQETILMDKETGNYIGINTMGSVVWEKLEGPLKIKEVITGLTEVYDVTPEQCEKEVLTYLHNMAEQDMLIIE